MLLANAWDTGQLVLVASAIFVNAAASIFGTVARTTSFIVVILKPSPTFSTVHAALVSTLVIGVPFRSRFPLNAMLKHAAWAAASNSSGLVPPAFSNREPKEYAPPMTPLSLLKLPFPLLIPPSQVALAFRVGIHSLRSEVSRDDVRVARGALLLRAHALTLLRSRAFMH